MKRLEVVACFDWLEKEAYENRYGISSYHSSEWNEDS